MNGDRTFQSQKAVEHTTPRLAMSEAHHVEQCSGATSGTPTIFSAARLHVIAWCRGVQAFIIKVALESTQTAEQQATVHGPHSKHNTDRKTLLGVNHMPTMTTGTCRGCASAGVPAKGPLTCVGRGAQCRMLGARRQRRGRAARRMPQLRSTRRSCSASCNRP